MNRLNPLSNIEATTIADVARQFGTPVYLYDEAMIISRCKNSMAMPNAFGITVRYAMKANSTKELLKIIHSQGLQIDASSMNEAMRAHKAGVAFDQIMLTTQEVPIENQRRRLEDMMMLGMRYNVCSLRQLELVADFAAANQIAISMRVHPGVGSGESASRNTGDNYSCFGIHLSDLEDAVNLAGQKKVTIDKVHVHIGSGGEPEKWRENIDRELAILEKYFPDAQTISFGGGLKDARMPGETAADIEELGQYAKQQIEAFYEKTGRKLKMEVEPGTYIVANAGYIITRVIDKKRTGPDGMNFLVVDGGMEVNTRPLLYGSQHPLYLVSKQGKLLFSQFEEVEGMQEYPAAVVGRCCESGDSQTLDENGLNTQRILAEPALDDYVVIGGAGGYCSSMSPFNYNSHLQAPEVLYTRQGILRLIRQKQTMEQMVQNELD